MTTDRLDQLRREIASFSAARQWEQYHSPKNLAMALSAETGELLALFQWLTQEETRNVEAPPLVDELWSELGDVMIYLVQLADAVGLDLVDVARRKLEINEGRFPPVIQT